METIAEKETSSGTAPEAGSKVPRRPLQTRIEEPLFDRVNMLAAKKRCDKRDIVTAALELYLPGAEIEAGLVK